METGPTMRYGLSKPQSLEARTKLPHCRKLLVPSARTRICCLRWPEAAALRNAKQLLKLTKKGSEPLIVEVGRARLEAGQPQDQDLDSVTATPASQ